MKSVPVLGHDDALAAIEAIRRELDRIGKSAVIAVADGHGELLAFLRMDDAPLSSISVACGKAFTAARLRRTSRAVGARIREKGADIAFYGDPRYVGFGGGVPVVVDGTTVGGIGVSALSDDEDEALAELGAARIVGGRGAG